MGWRGIFLGLAMAAALGGSAPAADLGPSNPWPAPAPAPYINIFQEIRVGAFAHNPNHNENAPVDLSVETLSSNLPFSDFSNPYVNWFLSPRIALGAMINTGGQTSYVFGSFNWRIPIYKMVFFEGELGGALNNSSDWKGPIRVDTGCTADFRESGGFGLQLTANWDVILSVEHISHASFCTSKNPGITDFGVRVGYKF
jgi:lipid A 3-O-deacylase